MAVTISGSTGIAGVDGSAGTPAVQGNDSNTGVFFPAADTVAIATSGTEAMRADSAGNVGIGTSSPTTGHTSGKTFAVAGSTDNSAPAATIMYGTSGTLGSGFDCVEVFAISGVTSATEITRLTGTGANGFQAYIEITVTGHNSGIANGTVKKGYVYGGGTSTVTEISSVTNSTPPVISFDSSTSNVLIIKLASSNGTTEFKGVAKIEVMIPRDFSGNTWVVS